MNVLLQNRPFKTIIYSKSNGKPKLLTRLSRNYDFVFTNLLKNEAELGSSINWFEPKTKPPHMHCRLCDEQSKAIKGIFWHTKNCFLWPITRFFSLKKEEKNGVMKPDSLPRNCGNFIIMCKKEDKTYVTLLQTRKLNKKILED